MFPGRVRLYKYKFIDYHIRGTGELALGIPWKTNSVQGNFGLVTFIQSGNDTLAFVPLLRTGISTGVISLLLFGVPLIRKRLRHKEGCCRRCGYPLLGLTEPRCPECGTKFL